MRFFIIFSLILNTIFASDEIRPFANVTYKKLNEISGIIKSKKYPNIYYSHNDSGDKPTIYAFDITKKLNKKNIIKIDIKGADAIDWEDIAYYGDSILIGDFGNNENKRKDLCIYMMNEPNPYKDEKAKVVKKIDIEFEDQKKFPPKNRRFDIEAMFSDGKSIYILTKHRDDTMTNLYKLKTIDKKVNILEKISTFDAKEKVTGADISQDGKKVLMLTYKGIWVFENFYGEDIFSGKNRYIKLKKAQYEAIAFDGNDIVFTTEQGEVFKILF